MDRARALAAGLCIVVLSGCATPILPIRGAGFSVADSPPVLQEPQTMQESLQKLNHVRAQYYEAIRSQQETSQNATTGLVWLGAAVLGMAYADAASGWIVGTSLIGGTTYGLAKLQLDARRVELWQQGIEALDCARQASLPLDLGPARANELLRAAGSLVAARDEADQAVRDVEAALAEFGASAFDGRDVVVKALQDARTAISSADAALASARALLDAARGRELSTAVDRITAKVNRGMNDIAVDVSAVKQVVGGIAGYATIFVPGIDSTLGKAFDNYTKGAVGPGIQGGADAQPKLRSAMARLGQAMARLASAQSTVRTLLLAVDLSAVNTQLKQCNISGVATALVVQPTSLSFDEKKVATRRFAISGGTPPYEVSLLDPAPDNTMSAALIGDQRTTDTAEVRVSAGVPVGTNTVVVKDSSTARRTVFVPVQVVTPSTGKAGAAAPVAKKVVATKQAPAPVPAADPATPKPTPVPTPEKTSTDKKPQETAVDKAVPPAPGQGSEVDVAWNDLANSLKKGFTSTSGGVVLNVKDAKVVDGELRVWIKCSKPLGTMPPGLQALLAGSNQKATAQLLQSGVLDSKGTQIKVTPADGCMTS